MSRLNGRFNYSFLVPRWNRIGYQPNNESSCPHCECNYSGYFYTDCGDLWAWNDNGEIAYRTREDDEFVKTGYTTHWKYNWQRASLLCTTPKRITNPADNRDDTKQFYGNYVAFQTGDNSCVIFYKRGSGYDVIYSGQYTGRLPSLGTDWHDDYENSTSCGGQWRISNLNSKSVSNITGYTQQDGSVVKVPDLTKTVQEYLDEYAEADAEAAANGEEADKSGRIDFSKPVLRYDYFNGVYSQHTPPIWSYCWEKAGHFGCGEKKSYTKEVYCKKHLIVNDGEESEEDIYDWLCEEVPESCGQFGTAECDEVQAACPGCGEHEAYLTNPENDYCDTEIEAIPEIELLMPKGKGTLSSAYQTNGAAGTPMSDENLALTYDGSLTRGAAQAMALYREQGDYFDWKITFDKEVKITKVVLQITQSIVQSQVDCKVVADGWESERINIPNTGLLTASFTFAVNQRTSSITLRFECPADRVSRSGNKTIYEVDIYQSLRQAVLERTILEEELSADDHSPYDGDPSSYVVLEDEDTWTASFSGKRDIMYVALQGARSRVSILEVRIDDTVIGQAELPAGGGREIIYAAETVGDDGKAVYGAVSGERVTIKASGSGETRLHEVSIVERHIADWTSDAEIGYALKKCYRCQDHTCEYNLSERGMHLFGIGEYIIVHKKFNKAAWAGEVQAWHDGLWAMVFYKGEHPVKDDSQPYIPPEDTDICANGLHPIWQGYYKAGSAVLCGDDMLMLNAGASTLHHRVAINRGIIVLDDGSSSGEPFNAGGTGGVRCCGQVQQFWVQRSDKNGITDKWESHIYIDGVLLLKQTGAAYDNIYFIGSDAERSGINSTTYLIAASGSGKSKGWYIANGNAVPLEYWDADDWGTKPACLSGRAVTEPWPACGENGTNGYRMWVDGLIVGSDLDLGTGPPLCITGVGCGGMIYSKCYRKEVEGFINLPGYKEGKAYLEYCPGFNPFLQMEGIAKWSIIIEDGTSTVYSWDGTSFYYQDCVINPLAGYGTESSISGYWDPCLTKEPDLVFVPVPNLPNNSGVNGNLKLIYDTDVLYIPSNYQYVKGEYATVPFKTEVMLSKCTTWSSPYGGPSETINTWTAYGGIAQVGNLQVYGTTGYRFYEEIKYDGTQVVKRTQRLAYTVENVQGAYSSIDWGGSDWGTTNCIGGINWVTSQSSYDCVTKKTYSSTLFNRITGRDENGAILTTQMLVVERNDPVYNGTKIAYYKTVKIFEGYPANYNSNKSESFQCCGSEKHTWSFKTDTTLISFNPITYRTDSTLAYNGVTVITSTHTDSAPAPSFGCCGKYGWLIEPQEDESKKYSIYHKRELLITVIDKAPVCLCDTGYSSTADPIGLIIGSDYYIGSEKVTEWNVPNGYNEGFQVSMPQFYSRVAVCPDETGCFDVQPIPASLQMQRCCGSMLALGCYKTAKNDLVSQAIKWTAIGNGLDTQWVSEAIEVNANAFDMDGNPVYLEGETEWETFSEPPTPTFVWKRAINPVSGKINNAQEPGGYKLKIIDRKVMILLAEGSGYQILSEDPYIDDIHCCNVNRGYNREAEMLQGWDFTPDKPSWYYATRVDNWDDLLLWSKQRNECGGLDIDPNPRGLSRCVAGVEAWTKRSFDYGDYGKPNPKNFSAEMFARYPNRGVYVWSGSGSLYSEIQEEDGNKTIEEYFAEYEHPAAYDEDTAGKYIFFNDRFAIPPGETMYPIKRSADELKAPLHCIGRQIFRDEMGNITIDNKSDMLLFNSGGVYHVFDDFGRTDYDAQTFKKL